MSFRIEAVEAPTLTACRGTGRRARRESRSSVNCDSPNRDGYAIENSERELGRHVANNTVQCVTMQRVIMTDSRYKWI